MNETEEVTNTWKDIFHAYNLKELKLFFKKVSINQSNLLYQCNPYQTSNRIFHRDRTNNPKIYMEPHPKQPKKLKKKKGKKLAT